jgi:Ca-activated chloride channel family protein
MSVVNFIFLAAAILITASCYSQENDALTKGNEYYKQAAFDLAERQYKQAIAEDASNTTAQYNLASALYRQRKFAEATTVFQNMRKGISNKQLTGASHYNEGVIYSKQKDLLKSIDAYKDALRTTPDDKDARENLQKALLELKKQQQDQLAQKKQQQPSRLSQKEAQRRLDQLQQKEKDIQERLQKQGQKGSSMPKDW